MKFKGFTAGIIASLAILFLSTTAYGHMRGSPILKVDGEYAKIHPIQTIRTDIFNLPPDSDISPKNYIVNQEIKFALDTDKFSVDEETVLKSVFKWDFDDGTIQSLVGGIENAHTYKDPGTYILKIYADFGSVGSVDFGNQIVQSLVLNVLPNSEYKLPQAVILVNGKKAGEKNELEFDLKNRLEFNAGNSIQGSSKIVSYEWDFDDGNTSKSEKVSHKYKLPQYYASPILRVKDEMGFFSDSIVDVRNIGDNKENSPRDLIVKALIFFNILIVLTIIFFVIKAFKKSKKPF